MMSLYGAQGMGQAGTGVGAGGMAPSAGAGLSPQLIAMLMQMQGAQGQGGMGAGQPGMQPATAAAPGPMQAAQTGTPMANYIGAPARPQQPMGMNASAQAGQPMGMQGAPGTPGAAQSGVSPQVQQLLLQLKGIQTGVQPGGNQAPTLPAGNQAAPVGAVQSQPLAPPPGASGTAGPQGFPTAAAAQMGGGLPPWLLAMLHGGTQGGGTQ